MLPFAFHSVRRACLALFLVSVAWGAEADFRTDSAVSWVGPCSSCVARIYGGAGKEAQVVGLAPELRWVAVGEVAAVAARRRDAGEGFCIVGEAFRGATVPASIAGVAATRRGDVRIAFDATLETECAGAERSASLSSERSIPNPR